MKKFTVTEIRKNFDEFLDIASRESVAITKYGKEVAIAIPIEEYDMLKLAVARFTTKA